MSSWINVGTDTFSLAHVVMIEELPEGGGLRVHFAGGKFPSRENGPMEVSYRDYRDRQAALIRKVLDRSARDITL